MGNPSQKFIKPADSSAAATRQNFKRLEDEFTATTNYKNNHNLLSSPVKRPQTAFSSFSSPQKSLGSPVSSRSGIQSPLTNSARKSGAMDLVRSSVNSGYSQLTTGSVMVGSAARSLKSREHRMKSNKSNAEPFREPILPKTASQSVRPTPQPDILTLDNSPAANFIKGTNTDDLNYKRPDLKEIMRMREKLNNQRPSTSYVSSRSKTSLEQFKIQLDSDVGSMNSGASSPVKTFSRNNTSNFDSNQPSNSIEQQLASVEDETDALLKDLQEWRVQHNNVLENIKSKFPNPVEILQNEKQVLMPIPPSESKEFSGNPVFQRPVKPRTPENGDHENLMGF